MIQQGETQPTRQRIWHEPSALRTDNLTENLKSLTFRDQVERRSQARKRLEELSPTKEELVRCMMHFDPRVRAGAVRALRFVSWPADTEVIDRLRAAIDDSNDYVVQAALYTLGALKAEAAREDVCACLADCNPYVVQAAVWAAARIGPPAIAEHFVPLLDSSSTYVRQTAIRGIADLGYKHAGPNLLTTLRACLVQRTLNPSRDHEARACIRAVGKLGVKEAAELLSSVATSSDAVGLRSTAIEALISLGSDETAPIVARLLADPSRRLCEQLTLFMVQANYAHALPLIRPLLKHPTVRVRQAALEAVAHWHDLEAVEDVRWMCHHDPSPLVRPQAIWTLVGLAGKDAAGDMEILSKEASNGLVRDAAVKAQAQLA